jgi:hypothetical protein
MGYSALANYTGKSSNIVNVASTFSPAMITYRISTKNFMSRFEISLPCAFVLDHTSYKVRVPVFQGAS